MALFSFQESIKVANFFYKTVGIQTYERLDGQKQSSLMSLIFKFQITTLVFMLFFQITNVVTSFRSDNFVDGIMTMAYLGFVTVGLFKMLSVSSKKCLLNKFMQDLEDMFPKSKQQQLDYELLRYMKKSSRIVMSFAMLYMALIWSYNLLAIMQYLIFENWLQVRHVGKELPYLLYIPWDWSDDWTFYPLYLLEMWAGYFTAAGQIACDLLLSATATQVTMHFDYVARSIERYDANNSSKDIQFIQHIIRYHEKILSLSDIMNEIFGVPILFNFMASSLVICFVGFQMTIGVNADMLFKLCLFIMSSTAQVYLICYHGQELIDASEGISSAAYNQNWYNADVGYKKMLVLIARRAQKPAVLKTTFFLCISRETMTDIMQMSYKFFALIRTMYND